MPLLSWNPRKGSGSHKISTPKHSDIPVKIGFVYDPPIDENVQRAVGEVAAEYEDSATITWMQETLATCGTVVDIPWGIDSIELLMSSGLDVIFNITEASGSRNRESLVPAVAETLRIPITGSDALAMGLSLDKYFTKILVQAHGVPTPPSLLVANREQLKQQKLKPMGLHFPLIVKPNAGGSSLGIYESSRVENTNELWSRVDELLGRLKDQVLVEEFVVGRELTVGVLDTEKVETLPVAELLLDRSDPREFYSSEKKANHAKQINFSTDLPPSTIRFLSEYAILVHTLLGCRDFSRADFRISREGSIAFLEINPLPGLSPYYGIFPALAERGGISPEELIGLLLRRAVQRGVPGRG